MQIADLQAQLRARTTWEAVDLGCAMARAWWRPLWASWMALVVPLQVLIFAVLWGHPLIALTLTWWLLPLWERVALFVLSRGLFGVQPTVRDTVIGLRPLLWAGLLGDLTLRRLSGARTIVLPVTQLERLSGGRATQRRTVLADQVRRTGFGTAAATMLAEAGALAGLAMLTTWVLPDGPTYEWEVLVEGIWTGEVWATPSVAVAWIAVTALIQPLRIGACFGLYLQRRTLLEGWDVELTFRRLAERLQRQRGLTAPRAQAERGTTDRAGGGKVAGLLLMLMLLGSGPSAQASPDEAQVRETADQVLAQPIFGGKQTVKRWKPRVEFPDFDDGGSADETIIAAAPLATGLQYLLFGVLGVALIGLLLSVFVKGPPRLEPLGGGEAAPATLRRGLLALDGTALPDHPAQAAWALWQAGREDEALALLYRSSVAHLVQVRHLEVADSATEGDCLRAARRHLPGPPATYLGRVTRAWQRRAYAHRQVEEAEMRALVDSWHQLDEGRAA